jgi:hypothetical protein
MPEYCFAFFGYIDAFPLELFASWATLPLGLLCLLGFISTLCLSGYFCLLGLHLELLCLLGSFNMLPLGHVLSTLSALTMHLY